MFFCVTENANCTTSSGKSSSQNKNLLISFLYYMFCLMAYIFFNGNCSLNYTKMQPCWNYLSLFQNFWDEHPVPVADGDKLRDLQNGGSLERLWQSLLICMKCMTSFFWMYTMHRIRYCTFSIAAFDLVSLCLFGYKLWTEERPVRICLFPLLLVENNSTIHGHKLSWNRTSHAKNELIPL